MSPKALILKHLHQ